MTTEVEKFAITLPPELSIASKTELLFCCHFPLGSGSFYFFGVKKDGRSAHIIRFKPARQHCLF